MPDYYQNVHLDLKDVEELDFGFYYDSKHHRYQISINYGEEYINVTRKEGETILAFLKILKDFLGSRRKLRNPGSVDLSKDDSSRSCQEVDLTPPWESNVPSPNPPECIGEWYDCNNECEYEKMCMEVADFKVAEI